MNTKLFKFHPYNVYLESSDHADQNPKFYKGIVNIKFVEGGPMIGFVPFFPKEPPFWPLRSINEDISNPVDANHARYYIACLTSFVFTPDDELAGQIVTLEYEYEGIGSVKEPSYVRVHFITQSEFDAVSKDLKVTLRNAVPVFQAQTKHPIKGKALRKLLVELFERYQLEIEI